MFGYRKVLLSYFLIISLVVIPLSTLAAKAEKDLNKNQNSAVAMTVDLVILRPLGLAATLCGTLVFVVSLPFSALGGNTTEAWNSLVATPAKYTFQRPLGDSD